jgi:hypothetical protein
MCAAGIVVVASDLLPLGQILDATYDALANGLSRFALRTCVRVNALHFLTSFQLWLRVMNTVKLKQFS